MREESHLDEMRTAIRGDFERLAERRGEQDLMRVAEEAPQAADDVNEPQIASEASAAEREAEPEPELAQPKPKPEPEPERRSLLARLFSPP